LFIDVFPAAEVAEGCGSSVFSSGKGGLQRKGDPVSRVAYLTNLTTTTITPINIPLEARRCNWRFSDLGDQ
jgi:hypothetical protein